ncbi:MAG: M56 family metallopeptidase [Sediminibacterium sp.]
MEILTNIPIALVNNIGFMALLFLLYESVKWLGNYKPSQLFVFAMVIQIISLMQFVFVIVAPQYLNLFKISSNITTIILPFPNSKMHDWLFSIGIIYCTILVYFLAKMMYHFTYLNQLNTHANYSLSQQFKSSLPKDLLSNCNEVKIGLSNEIETPITFGWMNPIILLPVAICNQLTPKEIETILIHEIAHIIRKDYLVNIIISLNQMILFFNPFSMLINKELSLQREIACDLFVVQNKDQKLIYMNALLKIAEHVQQHHIKRLKFTLGIFGAKSELVQRVQYFNNITNKSYKTMLYKLILSVFIGGTLFSTMLISKNVKIKSTKATTSVTTKMNQFFETKQKHHIYKVQKSKNINNILKQNFEHDLSKESYASLVNKTLYWIKQHEPNSKFANYQEAADNTTYDIADKLLISAIFSNYQLKRDLINKKLSETNNLKEALDFLMKSDEFEQMKQYEKWTKEFLQTHPVQKDSSLLAAPIIY